VADSDGARTLVDQIYVSYVAPVASASLAPLVLIHGAAQTGAGFETTPDGRLASPSCRTPLGTRCSVARPAFRTPGKQQTS
jgi:hypothetical protein